MERRVLTFHILNSHILEPRTSNPSTSPISLHHHYTGDHRAQIITVTWAILRHLSEDAARSPLPTPSKTETPLRNLVPMR